MVDLREKSRSENKTLSIRSNQEWWMNKSIKIRKVFESRPIAIGVETRMDAYGKTPQKREL